MGFDPEQNTPTTVQDYVELIWQAVPGALPDAPAVNQQRTQVVVALCEDRYRHDKALQQAAWHVVMDEVLATVWDQGWLPTDVARVLTARLSKGRPPFFAHFLQHHMHQFDDQQVHPEFTAQVGAVVGAGAWVPRYRPDQLLEVISPLITLPTLVPLLPLPGQYQQPVQDAHVEVDVRMLERVRALLAKAEATDYPAEAEAFSEGAHRLMVKHSIDQAVVSAAAPGSATQGAVARRVPVAGPYVNQKSLLLQQVAEANRCRAVWSAEFQFMTVVGFSTDVLATETLFQSLVVQAVAAMNQEGLRTVKDSSTRSRSFRAAFLQAFAVRIGERLAAVTEADVAAAVAQDAALVPVFAQRRESVAAELRRVAPQVRHRQVSGGQDSTGWRQGSKAADQAALHTNQEITTG